MRIPRIMLAGALVLTGGLLAVMVGCDDEPNMGDAEGILAQSPFVSDSRDGGEVPMSLVPALANTTYTDEKLTFRAKGAALPVRWSTGNPRIGRVEAVGVRSDYAIYDTRQLGPNTITATDAEGRFASAAITATADPLRVIPDEVVLLEPNAGPLVTFRVEGGTPPYGRWREAFPQLGTIDADGVYYVTTAGTIGTNTVSIDDAGGSVVEVQVEHVRSLPALDIIPESTSLAANGDRAVYIASGGLPPYAWSLTYPTRGHIIGSTSGSSITYERDSEGDQVLVVKDSLGSLAQETVTQATPAPPVIVPSSITLASNQTSYAFSVAQGTPPYTWIVLTGNGSVNPNLGTSVFYTEGVGDRPGSYILQVTDGNSQTALATIILE